MMRSLLAVFALLLATRVAYAQGRSDDKRYSPGLVAHYYQDAQYWGGLWPNDKPSPGDSVSAGNHTFSSYAYTRVEPLVNHLFVRSGWFSVRWQGYLDTNPGTSGENGAKADEAAKTYIITIKADDGCRLYIDGKLVIDSWVPMSELNPNSIRRAEVALTPGKHAIVVEYFQGQSLALSDFDPMQLHWSSEEAGVPPQTIPASHLSHTLDDLAARPGFKD